MINCIIQRRDLRISIESFESRVCNKWISIVESIIIVEVRWVAIVIVHCMGKDLSSRSEVVEEWLPHKLHRRVVQPLSLVLEIKSSEEPSVKSHISEESWIRVGMTKRIHMPADSWLDS
jgi:hypothetical protein